MAHLKHEHQELKAMFWVLKNERKIKSDQVFREIPEMENTKESISSDKSSSDFDSQNVVKRPARLLPYRVLIKYRLWCKARNRNLIKYFAGLAIQLKK